MKRRMGIALVAVPGLFVSLYLLLYHLGFYGTLACGRDGSCAVVQASEYATFLGLPVPGWGVGWYLAVLGAALWSLHAEAGDRGPPAALLGLAAGGVLFTLYLTGIEAFVLGVFCRWCLVSAGIVAVIAALAAPEARALRR